MPFLGTLLRGLAGALLLSAAFGWFIAERALLFTASQKTVFRGAVAGAALVQCLAVLGAAAWLAGPLRRAAKWREALPEALAVQAATAGQRLPARLAALVVLVGAATSLGIAALLRASGVAADIGGAGLAVALAATLLGAMLAYSIAAAASAHVLELIGPRAEVAVRGTVRGKILVVCLGLEAVGFLVFAASGYARYRAEVDREYVNAAVRAQEGAVALRLESPPGWLVQSRAPSGAIVASWLGETALEGRRNDLWRSIVSTGLAVFIAAAALAWVAARAVTSPLRMLGRAADRIASGDLTASPPSMSRDEVGQLAADFRRMTQGLMGLVADARSASEEVSLGAREAIAIGDRARSGALGRHGGLVGVQAAVEAIESSIALVSRGVGGLSEYVSQTNGAVAEMAASFEEVRKNGADLERAMAGALADVDDLAAAGHEAESTLGELERFADHAGGTLASVRASVASLERAAGESEVSSARAAETSDRAVGVVEETVRGIDTLRSAVSDAHRRITSLGRRSDDIDQVVFFIAEVAGRTNLLSLNASIIAAQAGEHGKAFAVVADQIRELAAQIARSTKSIGDIIHSVREDVEATAALIDRGDALAVEGVQLARNSLEALSQIQRSTQQAMETAASIRGAVEAHAASSREVGQVVESIAEGSRAVSAAVKLVGRSVAGVESVSRSVNAMADQVARALEEQSGRGKRRLESLSRLDRMTGELTRAVESHGAATRRVRDALQDVSRAAGEQESAVQALASVVERLGSRARALSERAGRFKV